MLICVSVNSNENVCISKQLNDANSTCYLVTVSDGRQTITVDSTKTYVGVDPTQLNNGMASAYAGGFNVSEMARYAGPTESILKAVANGTLSPEFLNREAVRIAHGLSLHTP
jgi:hypothetical protein